MLRYFSKVLYNPKLAAVPCDGHVLAALIETPTAPVIVIVVALCLVTTLEPLTAVAVTTSLSLAATAALLTVRTAPDLHCT